MLTIDIKWNKSSSLVKYKVVNEEDERHEMKLEPDYGHWRGDLKFLTAVCFFLSFDFLYETYLDWALRDITTYVTDSDFELYRQCS